MFSIHGRRRRSPVRRLSGVITDWPMRTKVPSVGMPHGQLSTATANASVPSTRAAVTAASPSGREAS